MNHLAERRALVVVTTAVTALGILPAAYLALKRLFEKKRLQVHYTSSQFILAAGAIPFQFDSDGIPRRVLLVHHTKGDAWMLAKGRKDQGEDLATAATREVFEETGYPCRLHLVPRLPTCAPTPHPAEAGFQPHEARIAENSTEPFMITFRPIGVDKIKLIFWYIGAVDIPYDSKADATEVTQPGSHQLAEGFGQVKLFDIPEAYEKIAFEGDRELVRTAVDILTSQVKTA
ncbi:hypothetical protein C8Q76DRAFT_756369 [Earliella scabrosa]|nr:hypothetical protein C8Q76DRAFT_756369 [Earliella scabrosa]